MGRKPNPLLREFLDHELALPEIDWQTVPLGVNPADAWEMFDENVEETDIDLADFRHPLPVAAGLGFPPGSPWGITRLATASGNSRELTSSTKTLKGF